MSLRAVPQPISSVRGSRDVSLAGFPAPVETPALMRTVQPADSGCGSDPTSNRSHPSEVLKKRFMQTTPQVPDVVVCDLGNQG